MQEAGSESTDLPLMAAGIRRGEGETVKRLKALEKENIQLKKLVAELSLDKAILKEIAEGAERSETACRRQPEGQQRRVLATW